MLALQDRSANAVLLSQCTGYYPMREYQYLIYDSMDRRRRKERKRHRQNNVSFVDNEDGMVILPTGHRSALSILETFYKIFAYRTSRISVTAIPDGVFAMRWQNMMNSLPMTETHVCNSNGEHIDVNKYSHFARYLQAWSEKNFDL
jgi:hypothetical protein